MRIRPVIAARAAAVALIGLGAAAGPAPAAEPVVAPGVVRHSEGNSNNLFPLSGDPIRYQQVIAAAEFPGGARRITRIAFRPDAAVGEAFDETLSNVRISLSTTPRGPGSLSKTFAENVGPDEVVVHNGPLSLSSAFAGTAYGAKAFDIVVPLEATFDYDPGAGNLLIEVRNISGGKTTHLDAHDAPDSTSRVWSDDLESPTATDRDPFPSVGLVIAFISD